MSLQLAQSGEVILAAALLAIVLWAVWCQLRRPREDPKFALWMALLAELPHNDAGAREAPFHDPAHSPSSATEQDVHNRSEQAGLVAHMKG